MARKKGRIDYYQRCDYTYGKFHQSDMRTMWNGLVVNKEDWDPKPKIFDLHSARSINVIPFDARPNRPLTEYTTPTVAQIVSSYKQYNP